MADEITPFNAWEVEGRLLRQAPEVLRFSAVQLNGKLYRSADDAHKSKAMAALNELLRQDAPHRFASPLRLLENARAVAAILTAYADATE
jgi:hypothetical protein